MTYSERYVAFVDILGFRELIRSANERQTDEILKLLKRVGDRHKLEDGNDDAGFIFQQFSDSIVMSANPTVLGLDQLLDGVAGLALDMLTKGLLLRGGIAKGKVFHDQQTIFGPAFLDAYDLERIAANFPRVVLSNKVYDDVRRLPEQMAKVRVSDDGPAYVHILRHVALTPRTGMYGLCPQILEALLISAMEDPRKFEKIKWFSIYWNSTILALGPGSLLEMVRFPYQSNQSA